MITRSKIYNDISFAHRQSDYESSEAMIHGHNWSFQFVFGTSQLRDINQVLDLEKSDWLKCWIQTVFDHKLVLNADDSLLDYLRCILEKGQPGNTGKLANITVVTDCSAEGLCAFIMDEVTRMLRTATKGQVFLLEVTVSEDSKNSATLTADEFIYE